MDHADFGSGNVIAANKADLPDGKDELLVARSPPSPSRGARAQVLGGKCGILIS